MHWIIFWIMMMAAARAEIPEYFKVSENFPNAHPACLESMVGDRANVYCRGRLLESVVALELFNDSKTFVDRPLKFSAKEVLNKFDQQFADVDVTADSLRLFVEENFEIEGNELIDCVPEDWKPNPRKFDDIADSVLRSFALHLHEIWPKLCKQMKPEVKEYEHLRSLISVPNKFIAPGGRFREFYYWDTFWIIKGLIASEMYTTARHMLKNFVSIVGEFGFVPNGGRIYYLQRSQPPLLAAMFYEYYQATGDLGFISDNMHIMEKELEFWDENRSLHVYVNDIAHRMYQYRAASNVPRPESFREDVELVKDLPWEEKGGIWKNLASAAEAGHDFSSRWLQNDSLISIETTNIVEVELNALICGKLNILGYFYSQLPNGRKKEMKYRARYTKFRRAFDEIFFVDREDGWYDFNTQTKEHNIDFYPTNASPLFARCYDPLDHLKAERVYARMQKFGAFDFKSGVPTSLHQHTGQQWDFPNVWPPLQHMIIEGFRQSESPQLQEYAFELAEKWIHTNYEVFYKTGIMWEKFNAEGFESGSGGEYDVQMGFGWSNGVVLDLLVSYAERLDSERMGINVGSSNRIYNDVADPKFFLPLLSVVSAVIFMFCLLTWALTYYMYTS